MDDAHNFDFEAIQKILHEWVEEMYPMEIGAYVPDAGRTIFIGDASLARRQAKHIIEQRKAEGKSIIEINLLFSAILDVILNNNHDFDMPNTNQRHPGSIMRIKISEDSEGEKAVVIVLNRQIGSRREIITAFGKGAQGTKALKKKLQKSTPGETPHP